MRRETLTDNVISGLDPEAKAYRVFDLVDRGLCVVVHPKGSKRLYRRHGQVWDPLGAWPGVSIASLRGVPSVTIDDLLPAFEVHMTRLKRSTQTCYRTILRYWSQRIGSTSADDLTPQLVQSMLPTDCSNRWRNYHLLTIGMLYRVNHRPSPTAGIKREREAIRDQYLTGSQVKLMWQVCMDYGKRADLFRFLLVTGLRLGEACALRYRDVDWDNLLIYLRDTKTGPRSVYINDIAFGILKQTLTDNDKPAWNRELRHHWYVIRERVGIPTVRVHDLRHTFASMAIQNGLSLPEIAELLGHGVSSGVTKRYAHLAGTRKTAPVVGAAIGSVLGF